MGNSRKLSNRGSPPLDRLRDRVLFETAYVCGAHATELINAGVSIEAVRRRLGHASAETTQLYALLDDKVADAEIRAARRRRDQTAPVPDVRCPSGPAFNCRGRAFVGGSPRRGRACQRTR